MKVKHFEEVKALDVVQEGARDVKVRWLITKEDGARNFAMRLFEVKPGGYTPCHKHDYEHEVFILEGEGKLLLEGKEYDLKPGVFAFVPENKEHQFKNTGEKILKFLCLIPNKD